MRSPGQSRTRPIKQPGTITNPSFTARARQAGPLARLDLRVIRTLTQRQIEQFPELSACRDLSGTSAGQRFTSRSSIKCFNQPKRFRILSAEGFSHLHTTRVEDFPCVAACYMAKTLLCGLWITCYRASTGLPANRAAAMVVHTNADEPTHVNRERITVSR